MADKKISKSKIRKRTQQSSTKADKNLKIKQTQFKKNIHKKKKSERKPTIERQARKKQDSTQYRLVQSQTQQALLLLSIIFNASTHVFYLSEAFGDYDAIYISNNIKRILGYKPKDFLKKGFWAQHIHPEDLPRMLNEIGRLFEQDYNKCEYRFKHIDGSWCWIHDEKKLLRDKQNEPKDIIGIITDITERKKMEFALYESETRYRELFEHINIGVAVYEAIDEGRDFIFKDFNSAAEKIDNERRQRLIGNSILKVRPNIKQFGLFDVLQKVWQTGEPAYHPITLYHDKHISGWYENYLYKLPSGEVVAVFTNQTNRKKTEEALLESEKKLFTVFHNAPVMICILDPISGKFIDVNDKMLQVFGYTHEQLIGRATNKIDWITAEQRADLFQKVREQGRISNLEITFHTKDGRVLYGLMNCEEISIAGRPCLLSVTTDITEYKTIMEQLRQSRESLNNAQRLAHIGSWVWHIQENRLECSDEMHRIFGIDRDKFKGDLAEVINQAIHPDDRAAVERANHSILHDKTPMSLEYRVVWPDGTVRVVWAEGGAIILDKKGNPKSFSGFVQDITERKQLEKNLKDSEKRYRELFNNASLAIFQTELNGKVIDVNPEFARMFGYKSPQDLLDSVKDAADDLFAHPERRQEILQLLSDNPEMNKFENLYRRKDNSTFYGMLTMRKVIDAANPSQFLEGFIEDITERKEAERALHKKVDELERFNELTVNRELRIIELKKEINDLLKSLGKKEKYKIVE